ncbi:uncharacterized protein LOC131949276 [Physella acuta]|uniref:uncharacterized protein LOC131949276 n=1 Tax=Physella acuta TaxID=109671 RepID=UPI0027DB2C31|nr:uncharacterized protein LOC131949276 [Physella acuta]
MRILMQIALVFVTILATVLAAVSFTAGPCSNGVKPGGYWHQPGCIKCYCNKGGFNCLSCDSILIVYDRKKCYMDTNKDATYPGCCKREVVCLGDRRFSRAKMAKAVKKLAGKKLKESNHRRVQGTKKTTSKSEG